MDSRMWITDWQARGDGKGMQCYISDPMKDPKAPRPSRQPLMERLGQMCADGKETAEYRWQVPKGAAARQKILELLNQIGTESAKQGRNELAQLGEERK